MQPKYHPGDQKGSASRILGEAQSPEVAEATVVSKRDVYRGASGRGEGFGLAAAGGSGAGRLEALLYLEAAPWGALHGANLRIDPAGTEKGVTLRLLGKEGQLAHNGQAYRCSPLCVHYHEYRVKLARSIYLHRAGARYSMDHGLPGRGNSEIIYSGICAGVTMIASSIWSSVLSATIGPSIICGLMLSPAIGYCKAEYRLIG